MRTPRLTRYGDFRSWRRIFGTLRDPGRARVAVAGRDERPRSSACAEAKFDLRVNRAFEFSHSYSKYSFSSSVDNPNVEGSMSIVVPLKAETDLVHVARKARQIVSKLKLPKKASVHVVNTGLGIGNPEEFRLPILEAIRVYLEETNKALGDGYEVSIEGITGSVRARQSGERKVQLYIPFSIVLNSR